MRQAASPAAIARSEGVYVAASTDCFPGLGLEAAISRLADLEFTRIEIGIREQSGALKPSQVAANLEDAIQQCRETHRLKPIAYAVDIEAQGREYFEQFSACCKLAKGTRVALVSVRAGELGTPFNAEVERLRELVKIASIEGVVVGVKNEMGRMTQDADSITVLCDNVKGLGLAFDPSHYLASGPRSTNYDPILKYVCHVYLRDSTKDKLQVRVGQGNIEYSRLIAQLGKHKYQRALCVHVVDQHEPGVDHLAELRKLRLLLESML
jgi:sugar phosphate isomerase/epimerase